MRSGTRPGDRLLVDPGRDRLAPPEHLPRQADVDREHPHRALPTGSAVARTAGDLLGVEALDVRGDLLERVLDGEVAAVEHVQLGVRQVAQVGPPALGREEEVVLAPEDQRLRLVLAQERLPLRIQLDVRAVVVQQVELVPARAGPLEEVDVHVPVVGADPLGVAVPVL